MTDLKKARYFIAIVPPEPFREELWALKRVFSEKFACKAALRSPPHITLHMPFMFRVDREDTLILELQSYFQEHDTFELCLDGYGAFPPRVIYADVVDNESLFEIQKGVKNFMKVRFHIFNSNYRDRPFRPHLTLAFRDLKKPQFETAWQEYGDQELSMCWTNSSACLLKHNGKKWEVWEEFLLKSS
jgi:2'-5' RNA ligase